VNRRYAIKTAFASLLSPFGLGWLCGLKVAAQPPMKVLQHCVREDNGNRVYVSERIDLPPFGDPFPGDANAILTEWRRELYGDEPYFVCTYTIV